jgi:choline-sulfatase
VSRRSVLAAALALVALGCGQREHSAPAERGPIIIISIDTLRSDHLPAYGYDQVATPAIDALRRDGLLFTNAWSHCPLTLPSHATILTGRLPAETGLRDNAGFRLKADVPTLAELLGKNGYATGAAVSSYALRSSTGISRGFDAWDDHLETGASTSIGDVSRSGAVTEQLAEQWIGSHAGTPFFYFLHLYEPHSPYSPPEPFKSRYTPYDGEIATADAIVGTFIGFLKKSNLYDRATIVLLSDHGEGLGEHGEDEHGILLYRETLQVPLIVKLPGARSKGGTVEAPVQLIDVFPTLAALAQLKSPGAPGLSLLDWIDGGTNMPSRRIFAETYFPRLHLGWSYLHSVIEGRKHLIRGTRGELFDLSADPGERHDLASEERRTFAALSAALEPQMVPIQVSEQVSPEEAKKLAALGYIGSASPAGGTLPDPRDHIASFRELRLCWGLLEQGKPAEALQRSAGLAAQFPNMADVWQLQGEALSALGRSGEAIEAAKRGLTINPGADTLILMIADLSLQRGDVATAREYAGLALRSKPADAHDILARAALTDGDAAKAAGEARLALAADPDAAAAYWTLGRAMLAQNDAPAALAAFDKAKALAERQGKPLPNVSHDRAVALITLGRAAEAEAAFKEELRLFPDEAYAYKSLIVLYISQRRLEESTRLIQQLLSERPTAAAYAAVAGALAQTGNAAGAKRVAGEGLRRYPGDAALRQLGQ